ncbi:PPE domain-containing protein [Haloactinomyces albus]|uniref:Uncharacterized protein YukE n=1 Tax=Haloactinomyces albus TaxID=1352928 RepID=A0AAE3ZD22_9ACTN|nr:PPE domain-containing protein [Haloactinomyces albus]MDR7302676.1 uncharacterized protein YukE [Haloactinomyces albus]
MGWGLDHIREVGGNIADDVRNAACATVDDFRSAADRVHDRLTPDIRPEGVSGHRIYAWFHHGPGTGSLDDAVDGWGKVSEKHAEVADAVDSAMGKLRASWEGEAATAAQTAGRALRDAADTASACAARAGSALAAQSFEFNEAKKNVLDVSAHPPRIDPLTGELGAVDYHQEARSYAAEQRTNQAALQGYGSQTGGHAGSVPRFDGSGGAAPVVTALAWSEDDGLPGGGGFEFGADHDLSGASVAAGAAGLAAGGVAVLGGDVLGERVGGRGGISGRGVSGFGDRADTGSGGAARSTTGAPPRAAGAGGRGRQGADDEQHENPEWLAADESPDELFGIAGRTAPPVLGALPSEREDRQ